MCARKGSLSLGLICAFATAFNRMHYAKKMNLFSLLIQCVTFAEKRKKCVLIVHSVLAILPLNFTDKSTFNEFPFENRKRFAENKTNKTIHATFSSLFLCSFVQFCASVNPFESIHLLFQPNDHQIKFK